MNPPEPKEGSHWPTLIILGTAIAMIAIVLVFALTYRGDDTAPPAATPTGTSRTP